MYEHEVQLYCVPLVIFLTLVLACHAHVATVTEGLGLYMIIQAHYTLSITVALTFSVHALNYRLLT